MMNRSCFWSFFLYNMDFCLVAKVCSFAKMETSEKKLQHVVGDEDELYKDHVAVNKGKEIIQEEI